MFEKFREIYEHFKVQHFISYSFSSDVSVIEFRSRPDWASAKVLLGDSNFLKRLYEYDKDNIPEAMLKKLKKYVDNPKFVPDAVEKVSKVCYLFVYFG